MINLTLTRSAFSAAELCVWGGRGQVAGEICELGKKILPSVIYKSQSLGKQKSFQTNLRVKMTEDIVSLLWLRGQEPVTIILIGIRI